MPNPITHAWRSMLGLTLMTILAAPAPALADTTWDVDAAALPEDEFPLPRHDPRPLMQALADRTADADPPRFTFAGFSDLHSRREAQMFNLLHELEPDFAITMGDIVNVAFDARGLAEYRRLEEHGGAFMSTVPTWAAPGNHEVGRGGRDDASAEHQAQGRARFSHYFAQPHDQVFSFGHANARFIGLPYEFMQTPELLPDLERELADAAADDAVEHIFVFSHHAWFTGLWRRANDVRTAAAELFEQYGVRAVFGGGTHIYYRQQRNGIHYILNATAGMSGRVHADRDHVTLRNNLPDDVWFARDDEGGQIIRPEGEEPRRVDGSRHFATLVTVEGPRVELRIFNTDGEEVDHAVLAGHVAGVAGEDETTDAH